MTSTLGNVASHAARGGGKVVRQVRSVIGQSGPRAAGAAEPESGWLVVTVLCEPSEIDTARLPVPLATFDGQIEVRVHAAPDGKGTELAARLADRRSGPASSRLSGRDPLADLRSALRRTKQLIEVGEVLEVDPAPHGSRTPTPGGLLLEAWTKAAPKGGVR
jgi:hypothetical protein